MRLHDRDLELEFAGDDVKLLHSELVTLGLPIAEDERASNLFGVSTQEAVSFLQAVYADALGELGWQGRPGVVERATAMVINRIYDRVVAQRDAPPPVFEPEYHISGLVLNATGEPVARATVTVSNQNVKGVERLGIPGATSEAGTFDIAFDFQPQDGAEARSPLVQPAPDLRFAVVDSDGHERRLLALAVLTNGRETSIDRIAPSADAPFIVVNASKHTQVVLHLDQEAGRETLSEFEEVEERLAPVLQGLSYDGLEEGDGRFQVSFLAAETGIARGILERLVASARSSRVTEHRQRTVPVAVFYGLSHASLPVDLASLSRRRRTDITSALREAIDDAVIPISLADDIDRHVDAILSVGAEQALSEPLGGQGESPRAWLALSGLPEEGQRLLMREMADHEGPLEQLWERLRDHEAMGGAETVRRAELVMRLANFTDHNFALVRLLLDGQDIRSVADVATLDEPRWYTLLEPTDVPARLRREGESAEDARGRYARSLMRSAQRAYPTAAIESLVARSHEELALDEDVSRWLGAARRAAESGVVPELDLRSTHIDRYFDEHAVNIEYRSERMDRVRADLKRIQRTLVIAEEPAWVAPLLREGHDSALKVANMPVGVFLETHGAAIGVENAHLIHARAQQMHSAHLFVHTMVIEAINDEARKI